MKQLSELLMANEDQLMDRTLAYAQKLGYARYTSTLREAWRLSISGLTAAIVKATERFSDVPELDPDEDLTLDPIAQFGIVEAQRHRERGVNLAMFVGLMKYYRQAYVDLIHETPLPPRLAEIYPLFVHRVFDRIEIGFSAEWAGTGNDKIIDELQTTNRLMTNEKNKYLTLFESLPNPIIILNRENKIDNMNHAAATLFQKNSVPGSHYYCSSRDRYLEYDPSSDSNCFAGGADVFELFPWLEAELRPFDQGKLESTEFQKIIYHAEETLIYRVKLSKNLDVSGKFNGNIVLLEDITSLKNALEEVRILRGFLPICSHCKNVRNDRGFWQQVEEYVEEHSEAEFSHSICPDCARKFYPDMDLYGD